MKIIYLCKDRWGENLILDAPLRGGNFALMKNMPGFSEWQERRLRVRVTGANIKYILDNWPDADWDTASMQHKQKHLDAIADIEQTIVDKEDEGLLVNECGYIFNRMPMEHQLRAFNLSKDKEAFGLFMEQGTGKTKVTIDNACYLYEQGKIDMMIVVAWPNGVHRNWVQYELPEDMSVPYMAEYWQANLTKKKINALEKVFNADGFLKVLTFNVEAFASKNAKAWIMRALKENKCLLVIDQSASIKNHEAKRTKFLIKVSTKAPYRRILDGSPIAEGPGELFSQFKFLNPMIIGHDTWTAFRAEYCEMNPYIPGVVKSYRNIEDLQRKIDGFSFRVLASECLDLPDRIYKRWHFNLNPEEAQVYKNLNSKGLAYFEGDELKENRALVKNLRLQQVASGWFYNRLEKKVISLEYPCARFEALREIIKQMEGKALIFTRFRADLAMLQAKLSKEAVSYHGGIDEDQRDANKHAFMTDPAIRFFLGQPRAAGIGHTLTAANTIIFYNNDSSLRFREECEKRAHRKGLKGGLIIWDLIASKTHDKKTVDLLQQKKDVSEMIMQDPESFFLVEEGDE